MPVDEDFYFAGDLSEADNDRTRLDHLERRLEVYLADLRQETERLRTVRRSWCQANFSQAVAHNTNTNPTLTMQYNRPGWALIITDTAIRPTIPGFYRCTIVCAASSIPAGGRMIAFTRQNDSYNMALADQNPTGGNPDMSPASRIAFFDGTTDYVRPLIYQFQGSGTAATTMSGSIVLEMVDVNSAGA
jgi:hypothetical protein